MKRALPIALGLISLPFAVLIGASEAEERFPAPPLPSISAPLSLRATDTLTLSTYLPLVMRAYRPPPPPPVYPDDPCYSFQWGLSKVNAPAAWALSQGANVLIAVLDTGADFHHPDLAGKLRGDIDWDFVNNDPHAQDDNGHGTHVSGIVAAATDNGIGVAGMGWNATILPLKVMDASGNGYSSDLAAAIYYAANYGARIINMSLGGGGNCPSNVQSAADYAYSRGVLLVAAAGNYQGNTEVFPANCNHVLGVAATTSSDGFAGFSNYGSHVSVAAPGENIVSTCLGGNYCWMDGTSMATPFVAGLAALVYARFSAYTPDQAASAILDNALDLGTSGWDPYYGCGRIDAFQTLWEGARGDYPLCLGTRVWWQEAAPGEAPFVPGEVVVTLRAGVQPETLLRRYGLMADYIDLYAPPDHRLIRLRAPVGAERALLARLRADPAVLSADLNYLIYAR